VAPWSLSFSIVFSWNSKISLWNFFVCVLGFFFGLGFGLFVGCVLYRLLKSLTVLYRPIKSITVLYRPLPSTKAAHQKLTQPNRNQIVKKSHSRQLQTEVKKRQQKPYLAATSRFLGAEIFCLFFELLFVFRA
jgi:hypothetical protein